MQKKLLKCPKCKGPMVWFEDTLLCIKCDNNVIRELAQDREDKKRGYY